MGFQFEQHRLGLWDLSWDLKKTISWEMGLGPPLHDPLSRLKDVTASTSLTPNNSLIYLLFFKELNYIEMLIILSSS